MFKRILTSALVFGMVAIPPPGFARTLCASRDEVTANLTSKYDETFKGAGFQPPHSIVEIWTAPDGGTWTILVTLPGHISCYVASGTNWIDQPQVPGSGFRGVSEDQASK
ncbi:MAG: hypothetical protein ACE5DK_04555 [Paracoccaceae bacterium]